MGNLSSGCGCGNSRMSNGNDCCSIIWIIILLSIFCGNNGCGNSLFGGNRCGCDDDCCGNNSCIWLIILLFLFCGNGFGFNNGCGCGSTWNNGCGDNCGC